MYGYIFSTQSSTNPKHNFVVTMEALKMYVTKECKKPEDCMCLFEDTPTNPEAVEPAEASEKEQADAFKLKMFFHKNEDYKESKKAIVSGRLKIYQCILGQCTEKMKGKLDGVDEFETKTSEHDCAWILSKIRGFHYHCEDKKDEALSLNGALMAICTNFQRPHRYQGQTDTYGIWDAGGATNGDTKELSVPSQVEVAMEIVELPVESRAVEKEGKM